MKLNKTIFAGIVSAMAKRSAGLESIYDPRSSAKSSIKLFTRNPLQEEPFDDLVHLLEEIDDDLY